MQLERSLVVSRHRDDVVERLCSDAALTGLLPGNTEIIARDGDRRTTRTHYRALGREGDAVFHWTFLLDGNLAFEKQCDGHVWRELVGGVTLEEQGERTRIRIEMKGRTKSLIPEFTIKGPMEQQIAEMSSALERMLEDA